MGRRTRDNEVREIGTVANFTKVAYSVVTEGLGSEVRVLRGDDHGKRVVQCEHGEHEKDCAHEETLRESALSADFVEVNPVGLVGRVIGWANQRKRIPTKIMPTTVAMKK